MTERSFRLQVTILAGVCREGGGAHGAQHWNYLHNCSVKAILKEEGNKELSVWAAPFGQIEILSAAIAPPHPPNCRHLASWVDYESGTGWAPVPHPIDLQTVVMVG